LRAAIRAASRASDAVVDRFAAFLRRLLRIVAAPAAVARSRYVLEVAHAPFGRAHGSRGLRAPPPSIAPHSFAT
jgi:hypothetical protein